MALETKLDVINNALIHCGVDPLTAQELTDNADARAVVCNARFKAAKQAVLRKVDWKFARKRVLLDTLTDQHTIAGISTANPAVITSGSHPYATGDYIGFKDVVGMTQINGLKGIVTYLSSSSYSVNIDSTNFTAWSSAGTTYKAPRFNYEYQHDLPTDCITLLTLNQKRDHKLDGRQIVSNYAELEILYTSDVDIDVAAPTGDSGFTEALALYLAWNICNHVNEDDRRRQSLRQDYMGTMDSAAADSAQEESPIILDDSEWIDSRQSGPISAGVQSSRI